MSSAAPVEQPPTQSAMPLSLLDVPGFHFSPVGLTIDDWVDFDTWVSVGRALEIASLAVQWYLGDWLNHGENKWGEKYAQVIDAHRKTGIPINTLRDYQRVACQVPIDVRTSNLEWSIHREVAGLPKAKQREVLAKAQQHGYSKRETEREASKFKKRKSEIEVLKSAEVKAWLVSLNKALLQHEESVPSSAPFLKNMTRAMLGMVLWQADRTIEGDCNVIHEIVDEADGVTDDELFMALQNKGYFMRDPDIDDRVELMIDKKRVKWIKMGGRKDNQRGDMLDFLVPFGRPTFD